MKMLMLLMCFTVLVPTKYLLAQSDDQTDGSDGKSQVEVEALYDKFDEADEKKSSSKSREKLERTEYSTISDLAELSPFEDVAVISRKFLPKTKRFEFGAGGAIGLNNAFFNFFGFELKGAYYFSEKYGLEFRYFFLDDSERDITTNLDKEQNVLTTSLVVPEDVAILAFKWVPMYGKMSLLNKRIVPFDLFFTAGLGTTTANDESNSTVHASVGQNFAMNKALAINWNVSFNFYQVKIEETTNGNTEEKTQSQSDLYLNIGLSFFFPEASYR